MKYDSSRLAERTQGQNTLSYLLHQRTKVRIIHYACESFINPHNRTPRITSISIYDFDKKQVESFSIHLSAQEMGFMNYNLNENELDIIEKDLLNKFFRYVRANKSCKWVHWKMKDLTYGFQVLELRFKSLKGKPSRVQHDSKYDLSEILKQVYSNKYELDCKIGKLLALAKRNGFQPVRVLTGIEEAKAFNRKNYHLLHNSTQKKVESLALILEKSASNRLKVAARFYQIYGSDFKGFLKCIMEHPTYSILCILTTLYTFYSTLVLYKQVLLSGITPIIGIIKALLYS